MKYVQPIWGKDIQPGTHMYMRNMNNGLADGIVWFQNQMEAAKFTASHVVMVVDEKRLIESSLHGVEYAPIDKYFDGTHEIVCREAILDERALQEALDYGAWAQKQQMNYDYTGLVGFAVETITGATEIFPFLRKWPVFGHLPFSRVCSALVMDMMKHTYLYKDIMLFQDYHITRIFPNKSFNMFPYKPFRMEEHQ